jgi:hypothetical protein
MNPFEKRASEHIKDDLAFLPYITPEPVLTHLEQYAKQKSLFERLVLMIGSPGSGKTTLARLFTYPTLTTLIRKTTIFDQSKALIDAMIACGALMPDTTPAVAGLRIPMESGYRGIWDLRYGEELRHKLLFSLIQSRALLGWLRGFEQNGIDLDQVQLIARPDATAALEAIGGTRPTELREHARRIERETYKLTASLSPPPEDRLPESVTSAYSPFDVIEAFEIPHQGRQIRVKPLLICDDANNLHPNQLAALVRWLARRELLIARWILTRLDALQPQEALRPDGSVMADAPGFDIHRETTRVFMQSYVDAHRSTTRRDFRRIAADMARRYLAQMPVFARRHLMDLRQMLEAEAPRLTERQQREVLESATRPQRLQAVGKEARERIRAAIDAYFANEKAKKPRIDVPEVRYAMERILIERYLKHVPQGALFEESSSTEPANPAEADRDIEMAAQLQLYHAYGRPAFYGFEALCDAASENAERFLHLAAPLVDRLEAQLMIRDGNNQLSASNQQKLFEQRARSILAEEDFPEKARVLRLAEEVARTCREKTMEPNASLAPGPNAWGIPQQEFEAIFSDNPTLARVLHYGTAYNIFAIVRDYGTKGKIWTLVELTGTFSLARGLSMGRGRFLERHASDMASAVVDRQ